MCLLMASVRNTGRVAESIVGRRTTRYARCPCLASGPAGSRPCGYCSGTTVQLIRASRFFSVGRRRKQRLARKSLDKASNLLRWHFDTEISADKTAVETIYRDRLRGDVAGEAIWEANRNGEVGDVGYMHYDGRFHKLYNIFDGNEIIPALPDSMREQICSQRYPEPKSYGATFRTEIGAGLGVDVPAHPTTEKWFEETGLLSTYLMEHESKIKKKYTNHRFDAIWIIEATVHAASYRHGVVHAKGKSGTGALEMHPIVANGASALIHYTTEDLHLPIIRGREWSAADADMHCIVVRPVRLRKREYLEFQSTKLLVSTTSTFRSALGTLYRSSASTPSQSTEPSLTGRGDDGRTGAGDEAGESHATDSLEGELPVKAELKPCSISPSIDTSTDSVIGPFEDDTARDTIDMVLDCILDDHPDLDGVLVDSSFRFDERMLGSDAATFRHEVLIVETQSTPTGRFAIVKWESLDCQSCGTRCYGRVGLIQHVAGCVGHQQLLQRMGQEWAQRAQRAQRAVRVGVQQQVQELTQVQEVHRVSEDAPEPAEKQAVEQALDPVRQALDKLQDPGMQQTAESVMEKVRRLRLRLQQLQEREQRLQEQEQQMLQQLQQLQDVQVQVHRAHQLHQAQEQKQKALKRAQAELRWKNVRQTADREHTTMEQRA
ncbi:hypothetical protein BKA62DRAFT_762899 [Auriculariales sp. MPI-PUGE-AT-0066]|nr:hypothetical protein BKA62DRAFT_762899 [Auriculariales sp. MPI-PUGE-AT-0066]